MRWFAKQGWIVDYAAPDDEKIDDCDNHFIVPIARSPYSLKNIHAYRVIKGLINNGNYNIIHCHTPMGALLARLVCRKEQYKDIKVIYTAHGFHFYKGAPLINWIIYYPVEKYLSKYTDCLITINDEDFEIANRRKFLSPSIVKIDGVGVDLSKFTPLEINQKENLRKKFGYSSEDFILICVAEFNKNKNQKMLIKALPSLSKSIPGLKVIFAGKTNNTKQIELINSLKLNDIVSVLGYRKDVNELFMISDVCVSMSKREGLPVNIIEALASGLPSVCTKIRGHKDIINDGVNGFLFNLNDNSMMISRISQLYNDSYLRKSMSLKCIEMSLKYSVEIATNKMADIYKGFF